MSVQSSDDRAPERVVKNRESAGKTGHSARLEGARTAGLRELTRMREWAMASPHIPSALDAATQMFPTLTAAQIDRVRPFGHVRAVRGGDILFEPGQTSVPFFVLLS